MRSFVEEAAWASAGVYAHDRTGIIAGQRYNGLPTRSSINMTEFYMFLYVEKGARFDGRTRGDIGRDTSNAATERMSREEEWAHIRAILRLKWCDLSETMGRRAEVAQLVEQRTENPCVGGSSPPLGTIKLNVNMALEAFLLRGRFAREDSLFRSPDG